MTTATYATGQGVTAPQFGGSGLNTASTAIAGLPDTKRRRTVSFVADLSKFTGTTAQSMALMHFPPYTQVSSMQAYVSATVATSTTIRVGDGTAYDTFVTAATPTTVGTVLTQAITTNPLIFYGANGGDLNITITQASLPTTGKITFVVDLLDCTTETPTTTQS